MESTSAAAAGEIDRGAVVTAAQPSTSGSQPAADPVVQYVVLRRDLWTEMKWPLGSIVAQACHASTAVMWMNRDDEVTSSYLAPENLDHMHKVRFLITALSITEALTSSGGASARRKQTAGAIHFRPCMGDALARPQPPTHMRVACARGAIS